MKALGVEPLEAIAMQTVAAASDEPLVTRAGTTPKIQTVIYIHGIGNMPVASTLKCRWDNALFGMDLGDRSRVAYWVNREYYPVPSAETCASPETPAVDDDEMSTRAVMALAGALPADEAHAMEAEVRAMTDDPQRRAWLLALGERMAGSADLEPDPAAFAAATVGAKVIPLPRFLRELITRKITRSFLRDVHDFLFRDERRRAMEQALIDRIEAGGGPFAIVAHSLGSVVAYNVLRRLSKNDCEVPLFITVGSPLGVQEVQDVLKGWGPLAVPACVGRWVNVADRLDPVAIDQTLVGEFAGNIPLIDHHRALLNIDAPRNPHSAVGYLRTKEVREEVLGMVGHAFAQPVGRFVIAKDLVHDLENAERGERRETLIQLSTDAASGALDDARAALVTTLRGMVAATEGIDPADADALDERACIDPLRHFVAARLTRAEVERLRTRFADLTIKTVWRNAAKRALLHRSAHTVQARPANIAYGASGEGIGWAVLDTGIRGDHPHFAAHGNIVEQWDCTKRGEAEKVTQAESQTLDRNGHGTHVAAVIAGELTVPLEPGAPPELFAGLAPRARLYGFKVLKDNGDGSDATIIKALDRVATINERAGRLVIHGVNLSLGGPVNPEIYNCGFTPLCQELRRLWGQGVLVVLAAGNEGYAVLASLTGDEVPANLDLTIGDPANLEEAIAVGSVHKTNPHTYGISYFSSRGPTADGRAKPDLVAPGEGILSAWHDWKTRVPAERRTAQDLYIEMSGTSMAAPHVSGLLAAFLSLRREFVGYPDRVKAMLLENCTDLKRDPYVQGKGMPNLVKMLVGS